MEKRNKILTKINDKILEIDSAKAFMTLANYLRNEIDLPGTKVVCAEGDCGACTILIGKNPTTDNKLKYIAVNSCILPLYLIDGAHIVTVEGLALAESLSEVQAQMVNHHGSQCGYCTPGFVCSMTWMTEKLKLDEKKITEKRARNFLTGNLCRCTGYQPILNAATSIDLEKVILLNDRFNDPDWMNQLKKIKSQSLVIHNTETEIYLPTKLSEAILLKDSVPDIKLVAGNTDLGVLTNKGKMDFKKFMSLTHIEELRNLTADDNFIYVKSLVTLSEFEDFIHDKISELKNLLHIFASPQIKNQGTLIGNVLNASPIGDMIPFLMSTDAIVLIESVNGKREVILKNFYLGYKKLDLSANELVTGIKIPRLKINEKISLYKISMRKDLDISAVTFAGVLRLSEDLKKIEDIKISYGGMGPLVTRLYNLENDLVGKDFTESTFKVASLELSKLLQPLSDLRASKEYRMSLAQNFLMKFYYETAGLV